MAGETGVIDYNGADRPWDSIIEPVFGGPLKPGYSKKRWLHADGSGYKGYQYPNGQLVGTCDTISLARQAALDAINTAETAERTQKQQFLDTCEQLMLMARTRRADNTIPARERDLWNCVARLFRLARGILNDS